MKKETPKKQSVRSTYTTLTECSEDPQWLRALDVMERAQKYIRKNRLYEE